MLLHSHYKLNMPSLLLHEVKLYFPSPWPHAMRGNFAILFKKVLQKLYSTWTSPFHIGLQTRRMRRKIAIKFFEPPVFSVSLDGKTLKTTRYAPVWKAFQSKIGFYKNCNFLVNGVPLFLKLKLQRSGICLFAIICEIIFLIIIALAQIT